MTSHLSRIAKEMIANSYLSPPIQNSYDLSRIKILCNEAHLTLLEAVFIPRHVSWDKSVLNLNSFNLRMTVEVETDRLSAIVVIGTFSINF